MDEEPFVGDIAYLAAEERRGWAELLRRLVDDVEDEAPKVNLSAMNARLNAWKAEAERRVREASSTEEAELRQCTFRPHITRYARRLWRQGSPEAQDGQPGASVGRSRQERFESFLMREAQWSNERNRKLSRARAAAEQAREAEEEAAARSRHRWVSAESRRMLQARRARLMAQHAEVGAAGAPSGRSRRQQRRGGGGGEERVASSPVLSARTRELATHRPSLWERLRNAEAASANAAPAATRSTAVRPGDAKRRTLSAEAGRALVERLYDCRRHGCRRCNSQQPQPQPQEGEPLAMDKKARPRAALLKRRTAQLAKRRGVNAIGGSLPFPLRVDPHAGDDADRQERPAVDRTAPQPTKKGLSVTSPPPSERRNGAADRWRVTADQRTPQRRGSPSSSLSPQRHDAWSSFLDRQALCEARRQQKRADEAAEQQAAQTEKEREACTFRPQLSPRSRRIAHQLFRRTPHEPSDVCLPAEESPPRPSPPPRAVSPPVPGHGVSITNLRAASRHGRRDNGPLDYTDVRDLRLVIARPSPSGGTPPPPPLSPSRRRGEGREADDAAAEASQMTRDSVGRKERLASDSEEPPVATAREVEDSESQRGDPLTEAETLLALSHWWIDLMDASLFSEGEALSLWREGHRNAIEDGEEVSTASHSSPSSLGREGRAEVVSPFHRPEPEDDSDNVQWLREATWETHSPFECFLPLPLAVRALSTLLQDGGLVGQAHRGNGFPEGDVYEPRRRPKDERAGELLVAEGGYSPTRRHARALTCGCRLAYDEAVVETDPSSTYELCFVPREADGEVGFVRCPVVLHGSGVGFREFIHLFAWLSSLLGSSRSHPLLPLKEEEG